MFREKKIIVANWKMHGSPEMARAWVDVVAPFAAECNAKVEAVVCPPSTLIHEIISNNTGFEIRVGGQDCHTEKEGAYTGDVSAVMLKNAGCGYMIVGHSERRAQHGETNEIVRRKAEAAQLARLMPIICVGETLAEREAGKAEEIVGKQLRESIPNHQQSSSNNQFILAYEPVWAIGTGRTATADDIRAMHAYIQRCTNSKIAVLYGGSVKAANAHEILTIPGVSGVLVGSASLQAEEFCRIIAVTRPNDGV